MSDSQAAAIRTLFHRGDSCVRIAEVMNISLDTVRRCVRVYVDPPPVVDRGRCPVCGSPMWPCVECAARAAKERRIRIPRSEGPALSVGLTGEDLERYAALAKYRWEGETTEE